MRRLVSFLFLAGCPPWITPAQHADNSAPGDDTEIAPTPALLRDDLAADQGCLDAGGGTAWHVGRLQIDGGGGTGIEQIVVLANPAWTKDGAPIADCWHEFSTQATLGGDFDSGLVVDLEATWSAPLSTCDPTSFYVPATATRHWTAQAGIGLTAGTTRVGTASLDGTTLDYAAGPTCIWPHASP